MTEKKIIEKKNVKENNPNDDEEILKNADADVQDNTKDEGTDELKDGNEKTEGSETIGIP
ncbi:MAG: hypothetical protein JWN83_1432 [Chitinophagaceae bacterium]|nr:hypothetical protein [Chitinophagaceae bacterium]